MPRSGAEREDFESKFEEVPTPFSREEREDWLKTIGEVAVSSDAFFPFSDNVYRLARSGVKFAAAPVGSVNDEVSRSSSRSSLEQALTWANRTSSLRRKTLA